MLFALDSADVVGMLCFAFVALIAVANVALFVAAYFWTRPRPGEEPTPAADDGLARYRFWLGVAILGFLSLFPAAALAQTIGGGMWVVAPSVVALGWGLTKVYRIQCPRCRKLFKRKYTLGHQYLIGCVHCGYPHTTAEDSRVDV